jgi:hypothetical protein
MPADEPTVNGVPVETICQMVWSGYSEADITRNLGVTHTEIVISCLTCVEDGAAVWRKRWGEWAAEHQDVFGMSYGSLGDVPLPPSSKEAGG